MAHTTTVSFIETRFAYVCNFEFEMKRARKMSDEALSYSIKDCQECIAQGINENKYYDQLSVYRQEQLNRSRKAGR